MKLLYKVLILIILNWFVPTLFNFMGVPSEYYINYMLWISALVIFSMLLPSSVGTMFKE